LRDALSAIRVAGRKIETAVWFVGPEGDFSPAEYNALRAAGIAFVSLGDLVLRTETAAIYGLCVLGAEYLV
jgi:16S rRNA (uracil1498-N3)-methyltransferase